MMDSIWNAIRERNRVLTAYRSNCETEISQFCNGELVLKFWIWKSSSGKITNFGSSQSPAHICTIRISNKHALMLNGRCHKDKFEDLCSIGLGKHHKPNGQNSFFVFHANSLPLRMVA